MPDPRDGQCGKMPYYCPGGMGTAGIDALGIQGITQEVFSCFQYVIRDKGLLMKSLLVICAVVVLFFVQSMPFGHGIHLDVGLYTICYFFDSF